MISPHRFVLPGVLLTLGIGWGSTQSLGKIAVSSGHGVFGLIFWQLVIGALVLGAVQAVRRQGVPLTRRTLAFGALIALIGTLIPNSAFHISVAHLPAGIMSILISTVPILAFPLALLLGMERFSALRVAGLACGLTGVVLIAPPQAGLPAGPQAGWVLFALIGPLFYAVEGNVVARWGTAGLDPVQAMLSASVIGAVMVLPLTLASGQWIDPGQSWGAPEQALILSSVIHAFMSAGYVWLARTAGAVFATQTSYVVTAAGVGWAMLLLGERFSPLIRVASAVMLLGPALVQPGPGHDPATGCKA